MNQVLTSPTESPPLPTLDDLGVDLLTTTRRQRWRACLRPFILLALYIVAVWLEWWWATPFIVFLIFVAIVTVTHDVVHGSLGLSRRATEWALFVFGAVLLESGHAYRYSHLQHHRWFPADNDPEGAPARMPLWQAILFGPVFLPWLWWYAWKQAKARPDQRVWLLAEASWAVGFCLVGVLLWPITPGVAVYALLVIVGSWVYPLLTVHLPHRNFGPTPLTQTGSLQGRITPALFLELTYHLEHHLYPSVPSHHLAELGRRLDPYFDQVGVKRTWVP